MSSENHNHATEAEAREVAEAAREESWDKPSFAREMFLGSLRMDLIDPYPTQEAEDSQRCDEFVQKLKKFLAENVDADQIDREGEIPTEVIDGLKKLGCFGLKIPPEYGGCGFSQMSYNRIIEVVAAHCGATATLLSAHQSIGVPQPLKMFGTEEQKKKYLPKLAAGAISAFALTEPEVGSDPANMSTKAELDGDEWVLNGTKLWCTNGTIADIIVVMAASPPKMVNGKERKQISAFIVETNTPGLEIVHRCRFMGLKAIYNGVLKFNNVRIPKENLLWKEGAGLKLALITLNTGRLTLPSCAVAGVKSALGIVRRWSRDRFQWGNTIGKHDEVAGLVSGMSAHLFAMQSVADLGCLMVDQGSTDVRLEAALAKLYNTEIGWKLVNDCFQVRGGRGYETVESLKARGEEPEPVERMLRDFRINTVVEGSTQIMHLFIAREALDRHVTAAGALLDPRSPFGAKVKSFFGAAAFYATWYPKLWFGWGRWPRFGQYGRLAKHVRFLDRSCRRLARSIFHSMMIHQAGLERRQRLLARLVDIGAELYAMAATCSRARHLDKAGPGGTKAIDMADLFCAESRRKVNQLFKELRSNEDVQSYRVAQQIVSGEHLWLEEGILRRDEDMTADDGAKTPKSRGKQAELVN